MQHLIYIVYFWHSVNYSLTVKGLKHQLYDPLLASITSQRVK